jgi:hypothetical protein
MKDKYSVLLILSNIWLLGCAIGIVLNSNYLMFLGALAGSYYLLLAIIERRKK